MKLSKAVLYASTALLIAAWGLVHLKDHQKVGDRRSAVHSTTSSPPHNIAKSVPSQPRPKITSHTDTESRQSTSAELAKLREKIHVLEDLVQKDTPGQAWVETLATIQTACATPEARRLIYEEVQRLLKTAPPDKTKSGKLLLLLVGSLNGTDEIVVSMLKPYLTDKNTSSFGFISLCQKPRATLPIEGNERYWESCFDRGPMRGVVGEGYANEFLTAHPDQKWPYILDPQAALVEFWDNTIPLPDGSLRDLALGAWEQGRLDAVTCEKVLGVRDGNAPEDVEQLAHKLIADPNADENARALAITMLLRTRNPLTSDPTSAQTLIQALGIERTPERRQQLLFLLKDADPQAGVEMLENELVTVPADSPLREEIIMMIPLSTPSGIDLYTHQFDSTSSKIRSRMLARVNWTYTENSHPNEKFYQMALMALRDDDPEVRITALRNVFRKIEALERYRSKQPALVQQVSSLAESDPDSQVRKAASEIRDRLSQ